MKKLVHASINIDKYIKNKENVRKQWNIDTFLISTSKDRGKCKKENNIW